MIKFEKPENLNGTELLAELSEAGIIVEDLPMIDGNGNLCLAINEEDKEKTQNVVSKHNGTIVPPAPTVAEKLASVGLSLEELKAALGGN